MAEDSLADVRVAIDRIDKAILQLLRERAQCAERVAEIKLASDADAVFYRPEREAQILARIARDNPGPLPDRSVQAIYKEIIASCLA
ncbi:MAG: chorismate mutase, partial [Pseudomonadota bacterium]